MELQLWPGLGPPALVAGPMSQHIPSAQDLRLPSPAAGEVQGHRTPRAPGLALMPSLQLHKEEYPLWGQIQGVLPALSSPRVLSAEPAAPAVPSRGAQPLISCSSPAEPPALGGDGLLPATGAPPNPVSPLRPLMLWMDQPRVCFPLTSRRDPFPPEPSVTL